MEVGRTQRCAGDHRQVVIQCVPLTQRATVARANYDCNMHAQLNWVKQLKATQNKKKNTKQNIKRKKQQQNEAVNKKTTTDRNTVNFTTRFCMLSTNVLWLNKVKSACSSYNIHFWKHSLYQPTRRVWLDKVEPDPKAEKHIHRLFPGKATSFRTTIKTVAQKKSKCKICYFNYFKWFRFCFGISSKHSREYPEPDVRVVRGTRSHITRTYSIWHLCIWPSVSRSTRSLDGFCLFRANGQSKPVWTGKFRCEITETFNAALKSAVMFILRLLLSSDGFCSVRRALKPQISNVQY